MSKKKRTLVDFLMNIPKSPDDDADEIFRRPHYVSGIDQVLGLPEIPHPMTAPGRSFLWVQLGAQQVHFRPDPEFKAAKFVHPGILVRGVDALAARLTTAGYAVTTEQSIAARRFHVRDPFGNRLEFIEAE